MTFTQHEKFKTNQIWKICTTSIAFFKCGHILTLLREVLFKDEVMLKQFLKSFSYFLPVASVGAGNDNELQSEHLGL